MGNIAEYNAQVPDNIKRIIDEKCMIQNRKLIKPEDINNISQALGVPERS